MHSTYFEAAMAFLGLASIVIGSLADRLAEYVLREPQATSTGRPRTRNQPRPFGA
ncbi:hypothetical protein [Bradyrhizobium sp. dw_411]|uniref:hypothetical protein n=1 Tax=Bradyrhizobium sp. dw_411 TaxID=2720082 RepID=UPI001BCD9C1B|nr:hypothetical protein [Bradyrhizobium sp. dw_411]